MSFLADLILPLRGDFVLWRRNRPERARAGLLGRVKELHAPIFMFWSSLDKHIGPEQRQFVSGALRDTQKTFASMEFADAGHAFFCDARGSYNKAPAEQAWALSLAFLKTNLQPR